MHFVYITLIMQYISCHKLNFLYYIIIAKIDIFQDFLAFLFCFLNKTFN